MLGIVAAVVFVKLTKLFSMPVDSPAPHVGSHHPETELWLLFLLSRFDLCSYIDYLLIIADGIERYPIQNHSSTTA